jgi:hypothetical protein
MATLFQADFLFEDNVVLKNLKQRVDDELEKQMANLKLINQLQQFCFVDELNWDTKRCFCTTRSVGLSPKMVKQLLKALLIEYYGEQALTLTIIIQ